MLSVIICTYNRERYIRPLLESLVANTLSKSEYEILLVDNNCKDNTRAVCREFAEEHPDVTFRYVEEHEQGLSAAKNCGIREAKGDLIIMFCRKLFTDFLSVFIYRKLRVQSYRLQYRRFVIVTD